ncbi:MAG TPA: hypothetical protein VEI02_17365, partial [Planctomycetota bacterium]|nr:hypothetical protein [Planctomycetota bacterium]
MRAIVRFMLVAAATAGALAAQDSRPESRPESRPLGDEVAESRPGADAAATRPTRPRRGGRRGESREQGDTRPAPETRPGAESRPAESRPASPFVAIVGGAVYQVSGPVLRRGTVLIRNDKIVDVGRDVFVPEGAKIIDAAGKHVTPGLVAVSSFGTFAGGFSPRGEDKLGDQVDPWNLRMLMALSSGITTGCEGAIQGGPGMFGGGGGRGGGTAQGIVVGFIGKHAYGTIEGVTVRDEAALQFTYAADDALGKANTRETLKKAVAYRKARSQYLADLAAKKPDAKAPSGDDAVRAWVRVMDGELPAVVQADARQDLEEVAQLSEDFDLPLVVTGAREAWTMGSRLARGRLSFVLNPRVRDMNYNWGNPELGVPNGWSLRNAALLSEAGLKWCVQALQSSSGTDGIMG